MQFNFKNVVVSIYVSIKRDFAKIAKISTQQGLSSTIAKISSRKIQTIADSTKINSLKKFSAIRYILKKMRNDVTCNVQIILKTLLAGAKFAKVNAYTKENLETMRFRKLIKRSVSIPSFLAIHNKTIATRDTQHKRHLRNVMHVNDSSVFEGFPSRCFL